MHLVVYNQSSSSVPATFDGLAVSLQPNASVVVAPDIASISGAAVEGVNYATVLVGDGGSFVSYPIHDPMASFFAGFGLGVGLLGFVILLSITKLLSRHSPDF